MGILIFIDVHNPDMADEQAWNEAHCQAVYLAMCRNENKNPEYDHHEIRSYIETWCKGKLLDFRFEHTKYDTQPIETTVARAQRLYQALLAECQPVGLTVSWHDGVT